MNSYHRCAIEKQNTKKVKKEFVQGSIFPLSISAAKQIRKNFPLYQYNQQNIIIPIKFQVCATTGRGYTYEQGFKLSSNFAANLRKKFKIRDGDTVAVILPNIPDFPLITLGILEAGGVISTINPAYTARKLFKIVNLFWVLNINSNKGYLNNEI